MDVEYDRKFEEMKKYIPFLESMIKRLESTSTAASNPRQAQLDKIRSLRDLLLDKKKRMKMENLLKCEQVLVNLYAKVEQRDALPNPTAPEATYSSHTPKNDDKDLEKVRNKLKTVTTKPAGDNKETLPEISRASEIEEICTPGSKEPALFQRRPNKPSISPTRSVAESPSKSGSQSSSKRNYTRVLVSPEPSSRRWSESQEPKKDLALFSRRSPTRKSPKRYSPSREKKKEKKKASKQEKLKKAKGLNITLNVPEDSLDSLNTKDILSRIMNCNDNDMDIETLREAKRQILSELNQTGAKYDDISDLLLKSYKNKIGNKKKHEVEEGELSDSESEAIESIYGGLNSSGTAATKDKTDDKEQPRKIQICLVLNSEDDKSSEVAKVKETNKKPLETDVSDFQMYGHTDKMPEVKTVSKIDKNLIDILEDGDEKKTEAAVKESEKCNPIEIRPKPANFYKPLKEQASEDADKADEKPLEEVNKTENANATEKVEKALLSPQKTESDAEVKAHNASNSDISTVASTTATDGENIEIPLLNETVPTVEKPKKDVVSEIDILQALKNEILSESISIPGSEAVTPALHQPKLTKVASAQEIVTKKRISIEKYKEKSELKPKARTPLFTKSGKISTKDDLSKKQSLKLTTKECERFNFPTKLSLDEDGSSGEDYDDAISLDGIYDDIAPKSPDFEDSSDVPCTPPIIIPEDPVKNVGMVVPSKEDVDMRKLPLMSPNATPKPITSPAQMNNTTGSFNNESKNQRHPAQMNTDKAKLPSDPRIRRDTNLMKPDGISPPVIFPNMTPSMAPNMTPSRNQNMTPSRTPIMTPNSRSFDIDENVNRKHVYTPMFTSFDRENSVAKEQISSFKPELDIEPRRNRWESERDPRSNSVQRDAQDSYKRSGDYTYNKNTRYSIDRRDSINRSECPRTPIHPFGRADCPPTPNPYGIPSLLDAPMTPVHPFGRSDCPPTPSHPFGRSDCPPTPSHPFGRSECPPTPVHPFGRVDCPPTPSHPFGRSDCPPTPSHPFGRSDCPSTPSHPFGRSECPTTPIHPFGRGEMPNQSFGRSDNAPRDPRLNRSSDYDKYQKPNRDRNSYYRDRNTGYKPDGHNKSYEGPDSYRTHRERSVGRNEYHNDRFNKYSSRDRHNQYGREHVPRREHSVGRGGRAISREVDNEPIYSRDRNYKQGHEYYNRDETSRNSNDIASRRGFYRERSVGRSAPEETLYRSSSRAPSVGRVYQAGENEKRLSVKSDAGRSFTIDTSVNSTFQEFLESGRKMQVFDYSADNRRQRAASVGRSLFRESSVGRSMVRESSMGRTFPSKPAQTFGPTEFTRKPDYRRASSVGRDIVGKEATKKEERCFKDIKADFEQFKSKIKTNVEKSDLMKKDDKNVNNSSERRSRKDSLDTKPVGSPSKNLTNKISENTSKKAYSPRKNIRDPRLKKDLNEATKKKPDERNLKHEGIVYSNDNITKGTILGSGYGVKNYKIPKIKRPVEEKEVVPEKKVPENPINQVKDFQKTVTAGKTETDKKSGGRSDDRKVVNQKKDLQTKTEMAKATSDTNEDIKVCKNKKKNEKIPVQSVKLNKSTHKKTPLVQNVDLVEKSEKRVTRLSRKNETVVKPVSKPKTSKKAVIYDSDEDEENSNESIKNTTTEKDAEPAMELNDISAADENTLDSQSAEQMDSSFGIEDLEMFSDNIVSDPVIDNINALIADLDNELGPTKIVTPTDFSNDIIGNMLDSITNPGKEDTKSLNEDEKLNDISEVINNDLHQSGSSLDINQSTECTGNILTDIIKEQNKTAEIIVNSTENAKENPKSNSKDTHQNIQTKKALNENKTYNDDLVTTSDIDESKISDKLEDKSEEQCDIDGRSTPDSTNNSNEIGQSRLSQESVPDSTNEVQNETNSIVSSTHDPVDTSHKDNIQPSSSNKDTTPSIDSLGSFLSILKNKSKIKELLSLLGDKVNDNDKIKKKLEKLSEIVSDEEDDTRDNMNKSKVNERKDVTEKNETGNNDETAIVPTTECQNNTAVSSIDKKEFKDENQTVINEEKRTETTDQTTKKSNDKKETKASDEGHDSIDQPSESAKTLDKEENKEKADEGTEAEVEAEEDAADEIETATKVNVSTKKMPPRRRRKGKFKKNLPKPPNRITRSQLDVINATKTTNKKKPSRELKQLQESIKEMFMKDEILNATGIRMCRIAKLVEDKKDQKEDAVPIPAPLVVIEKDKEIAALEESLLVVKSTQKKNKGKPKSKVHDPDAKSENTKVPKYKPGPKSKTKPVQKVDDDPYEFESDSVSDIMNEDMNEKSIDGKEYDSSNSESESLASSKSYGSSEVASDQKKKAKRKRSSWKSGIIRRIKRKKVETKTTEVPLDVDIPIPKKTITIPDPDCFTDKTYCFSKNVTTYSCRLCVYSGDDIVAHYKQQHPHSEIPLSRMDPRVAREAIEQCGEINLQAISKIPTDKYVCRFCNKEFVRKKQSVLEAFFWHVVSMHTGEYKKICSECVNITRCPFNLDIPPPPKDIKGQLIGYICEKCNFTQISLENLKTHVIDRHNDEQTEVYTINLAVMSKTQLNKLNTLAKQNIEPTTSESPRVLRSTRSNQSMTEPSDDPSDDVTDSDHTTEQVATKNKRGRKRKSSANSEKSAELSYQTKITYENEDSISDASKSVNVTPIKIKKEFEEEEKTEPKKEFPEVPLSLPPCDAETPETEEPAENPASNDIFDYPHFKITYSDTGLKEYVCCINGKESHYKTNLLISMKRHIQIKHKELWDGYCFICKVIVTPQGHKHDFRECLQHLLDKHIDNFPVLENPQVVEATQEKPAEQPAFKPCINIRPISELISTDIREATPEPEPEALPILPKIESIVSLGATPAERVASPVVFPVVTEPEPIDFRYEEVQAAVMAKKHQVVLASMMSKTKLVNVYKCAGRYCSFTSDCAEDALVHASTHARVGGEGSLSCAYCNFDCKENAIDLVMHVFKSHGCCPFVCGHCFYRAAAAQLVVAHITKMHIGMPLQVLSSTVPSPTPPKEQTMLPREVVVRYYVCPHACKYRTYTALKFCEHIQQRHASYVTWHSCYICSTSAGSASELVEHMKTHQLNVYQCTWCVHGADNEAQLLAHAAAAHPDAQPQAYLRLITSKDGSKEFRVLPLASFNKTSIDVMKVTPTAPVGKDNPVREAERSIDLEKLIGHTAQMIQAPVAEAETSSQNVEGPVVAPEDIPDVMQPLRLETPPPMSEEERSQLPTPKLKTEPEDSETPEKPKNTQEVIYCLDSDDEDSRLVVAEPRPGVIDLSDDEGTGVVEKSNTGAESSVVYQQIPSDKVLKCPVCMSVFKNVGGFKRHTTACFEKLTGPVSCPHCGQVTKGRDDLCSHYILEHCSTDVCRCGICNAKFFSVNSAKKHMKQAHKQSKVLVKSGAGLAYTVEAAPAPARPPAPKRKLSGNTAPEPPTKVKKYGPADVDRLPINPILDESVHCALCEFSTKVRLNMVRHLQFHADQQPVPHTAPINPVPHLETNEMHFDRMVNLASSSVVNRAPERTQAVTPAVTPGVPAALAEKYPRLVQDRQRYACGAQNCTYMSVDEELFRFHWDTLHSNLNRFRCTHCGLMIILNPPTGFPAIRDHLLLHASTLYACSACQFHHHSRQTIDKHVIEAHTGARVIPVRETEAAVAETPAPTMDLKPWQCGLCEFRSLLRQEIVDHCGRAHQSKMQYKCPSCPFRTSTLENVTKHMTNSHPGRSSEVFYYFYREGTVPDEGGVPRWMRQRQKAGITTSTEIKTEVADPNAPSQATPTSQAPPTVAVTSSAPTVDLNIVKKEVSEGSPEMETIDGLKRKYGQFCEPNGLNYKCPLCQVVVEDTREAMQSHLYEELGYRRWVCGTCSYRAFHSVGLNEHIISEHRGQNQSPMQLPPDHSIERWVFALLDYQTTGITKNKESLAKQKILTERPPRPTKPDPPPQTQEPKVKATMAELEKAFGPLGVPNNMVYCCPKCNMKIRDESAMRNHLESELTKIRWCCSTCNATFQTYHEAQFHCKSAHAGQAARPREAERSPALRTAWLDAVLQVQKLSMRCLPLSGPPEPGASEPEPESLLVVRYETPVPAPEAAPGPAVDGDPAAASKGATKCPHCPYESPHPHVVAEHVYRHFNLKPYTCTLCDFQSYKTAMQHHIQTVHSLPYKGELVRRTEVPGGPPLVRDLPQRGRPGDERRVCLACERTMTSQEAQGHRHEGAVPEVVLVGTTAVRCNVCSTYVTDVARLRAHFATAHPAQQISYVFHKMGEDKPPMRYSTWHSSTPARVDADEGYVPPVKRIAKKSTAKPAVAKLAGEQKPDERTSSSNLNPSGESAKSASDAQVIDDVNSGPSSGI